MSGVLRSIRVTLALSFCAVLGLAPIQAAAASGTTLSAADTPNVFITELQTNSGSASEEFIELYNNTDYDIDFADQAHQGHNSWKLQFFSSASVANGAPDWTKPSATISLTGSIPAHDYYLLSSAQIQNGITTIYRPGSIDPDQTYGARLADTGGGIQLINAVSSTHTWHDRVMWQQQNGTTLPDKVLPTPPAGSSLQRVPNDDNEYVNSDGSLQQFTTEDRISPKDVWTADPPTEPDTNSPNNPPTSGDSETDTSNNNSQPIDNTDLAAPQITEALPNPASPATDAAHEFIELYNPNDSPFNLKGYTLETGTNTVHDFIFSDDFIIPANSYVAFYSSDTKLSLGNSGGQARLLDPSGAILSQTDVYSTAKDGEAWTFIEGTWQWTTTPTPNANNILTSIPVVAKTSARTSVKKATAKTAAAKVKGTSSTKSKKASAAKTKKPKTASNITSYNNVADTMPPRSIHPLVLVGVVVAALLYGAYEYRQDLANRFYQFRANRSARSQAREKP